MDSLLEPFKYEFFRNATVAGILIGIMCGLLGVYIVLRGMSYIGHGLSHAIFGGAAVAYVVNADLNVFAGIWGFTAAILINWVVRRFKISADAAIGVITTASFAVGVAIISQQRRFTRSIDSYLFGSILGVTGEQLLAIVVVGIVIVLGLFFLYKQLLFTSFDTETAYVYGIPSRTIDNLFALGLAAALVVSMQVIGVTLIAAAIVIPPITARLFTDRFDRMLILSASLGAITSFVGLYASFKIGVSSGASIVITQALVFVVALIWNAFVTHRQLRLAFHDHGTGI